jgi:O-antigen ligase
MTPRPPLVRRAGDLLVAATAVSIPLSTTGMQVGVVALAALTVAAAVVGQGVVRATPLDGVLALFYGSLALSTLASGRPLEAAGWSRLWVVLTYFVVFWWLRDRRHAARTVRLLVAAAAVTAAYGIVQHYTGADWYRTLLGRATEVHPRQPGASGYAVVGFFGNYLTFAHCMVYPLAFAVALAARGARLGLVAAPLLVVAIVFSTARGAWLAFVALAAGVALLARGRRTALVLGALGLTAVLGFALAPDLRAHAAGMFAVDGPNRGRLGIYRANLDIIREHPVLGLGFGRYKTAGRPYYEAHPEADRRSHAHNNYLQIAAEAGLTGLAAFGLLFATALYKGWAGVAGAPGPDVWAAAAGAWLGVVAGLVGGLTQYTFGDNEVALTMWLTLAILMRCAEGDA